MSVEEGASVSRPLEGRDENAEHVGTGEKDRDVHALKEMSDWDRDGNNNDDGDEEDGDKGADAAGGD
jgi:hypothetical protein